MKKILIYMCLILGLIGLSYSATLTGDATDLFYNSVKMCQLEGNQNFDSNTLFIDSVNNRVGVGTASPTSKLEVVNAGTDAGLLIDHNGNGKGLRIDSEATSTHILDIDGNAGNLKFAMFPSNFSSLADFQFYRNLPSSETSAPLVNVIQTNAGDDQTALNVLNDGTGKGLFMDINGNGVGLNIDSEATTKQSLLISGQSSSSDVAYIQNNGALVGPTYAVLSVLSTNAGTTSDVARINQLSSSSSARVLDVINAGTGNGLFLDQNGNGRALNVDSLATTLSDIRSWNTAVRTGSGANSQVYIANNQASSTGTIAHIQNLGTGIGLVLDQDGNGYPLLIANTGTKADIHINPHATAPATCSIGDIYADTSGAYCFCSSTNTWSNTIAVGTCA